MDAADPRQDDRGAGARRCALAVLLAAALWGAAQPARAADDPAASPEIRIHRAAGPITVDGDLSDPGWQGAARVETFFETNPGDNVPASVKTVAYLTYDDRYFYAGFEFFDPDPVSIRAPLGVRDYVPSYTDYGGIIVDSKHDGKTGILMLANPRNVQYDAITDDVTGNEDSSYDLYWDSATRINATGWVLEMRVPFSSLRYSSADPQTWGILLYRNRPRSFRVQMFNAKLPRGTNCFICHAVPLTGLSGLPKGGHLVAAPYAAGKSEQLPLGGAGSATPLGSARRQLQAGLDAKWTPDANNAVDLAINPDFSQVESDVAQISTNQRFALFYPEKRPFFLEGLQLYSTPIQAVYTRSITSPRWGGRATGEIGQTSYTFLVTEDRGGGTVIEPGPLSSSLVDQDFGSTAAIGRARYEMGRSFASVLLTDREEAGGGHNRVFGPDFQWRPNDANVVTGQLLLSDTQNLNRPDLSPAWTGQHFFSHALDLNWNRSTRTWDNNAEIKDFGDGFRADDGFVPQVGFRDLRGSTGYNLYPEHALANHVRPFFFAEDSTDQSGALLLRRLQPGISMNGRWSSYAELDFNDDRVRAGDEIFNRRQLLYNVNLTPSQLLSLVSATGFLGQEIDFDNVRPGRGGMVATQFTVRPTDHLAIDLYGTYDWLDVHAAGRSGRLFTATVGRLRAVYCFTARAFVRLVGQDVAVRRDTSLYVAAVNRRDDARSLSALFGYRLNWQTVLYLGYDDERAIVDASGVLLPASRTLFFKISYAFQH
ncbi:MAG: carbohydrate binding family 9 domain-containing protein [Acidobacteria bacterium]|nr:carbohydrate binding family 9 domain-containing protein [Acidobacteriota bacterium]